MIHIYKSLNVPPSLLSQEVSNEMVKLTNILLAGGAIKYSDFKETLYGAVDVKSRIRTDQNEKCAYCETTLLDKNGGEVEHFRPKTAYHVSSIDKKRHTPAYYWLAYQWDNLLCCCHECNRIKSTAFPLYQENTRDIVNKNLQQEQPILLNPCDEDPADIMEYRMYLVCPKIDDNGHKNDRAKQIIDDYLQLNRSDLKELRMRRWQEFVNRMHVSQVNFDTLFQQKVAESGFPEEDVEFLGMYTNQCYKDV